MVLDLLRVIRNMKRIKNGKKAKISNKQIVNRIIDLKKAEQILEGETFNKVYNLYMYYNDQNKKEKMDLEQLLMRTACIMSKFDEISIIELYSAKDFIFESKEQRQEYMKKVKLLEKNEK